MNRAVDRLDKFMDRHLGRLDGLIDGMTWGKLIRFLLWPASFCCVYSVLVDKDGVSIFLSYSIMVTLCLWWALDGLLAKHGPSRK